MPFTTVKAEMDRWKAGNLHSGGPEGKIVTDPKQAIAIALSEQRKAQGPKAARSALLGSMKG